MSDVLSDRGSSDELRELTAALRAELHSFHLFEMFLGALFTVLAASTFVYLYWQRKQRLAVQRERHDAARSITDLDARSLKRILGEGNIPSWMKYPDNERVGWINDLLKQLWPHAAAAAAAKVREELEPALSRSKPRWMTDICLHTFTLGDAAPHVSAIKVYKQSDVLEEAMVEVDLVWAGQAKFQLLVKPLPKIPLGMGLEKLLSTFISMRAGVSDLYISGRVRISMSPLLNRLPVVGALQISLVAQPEFTYNLSVQGGDITFLPGLEAFINSFLRDTVLRPYILPEGFNVSLDGDDKLQVPKGMVQVKVIEAKHVPWLDWWSRPDCYVRLAVRDKHYRRTHTINNKLHPRWQERFEMLVHHPQHQYITAELFDHNLIGKDEEIGRVQVPIADLQPGEAQDLWLDLEPPQSKSRLANPLDAGLQGVRTVQNVIGGAASLAPFVKGKKKQCRLHLEATYFRVGEEEVHAAAGGADADQLNDIRQRTGHDEENMNMDVINMLRGGVLYVKVRKPQDSMPGTTDLPSKASQVRVTVAGHTKCTAAVEGLDNPDWEEVLDFALGGDILDVEETQIQIQAWDYHWVNFTRENLTWGSRVGTREQPGVGTLNIPLQEVIKNRVLANDWQLPDLPTGRVDLELKWLPILEH
ncbi:hypothetical protein WJX73_010507 [Symbiochloris irregularis]|uniref:Plant synaptotagmin n=1 Tax=Symbiochloris irregularis TaxID=706552 RepID=A0AAW1PUR9_9CHLO